MSLFRVLCRGGRNVGPSFHSFVRTISTPPATTSCQNVTLPVIPELFEPNFLDALLPLSRISPSSKASPPRAPQNPMIDILKAAGSTETFPRRHTSTSSPTLNAFKALRPRTLESVEDLWSMLDKAWEEDPALTLRLIWNSRSVIDGKGFDLVFYHAYGWLYEKHPRTAIYNLPQLIEPVCTVGKTDRLAPHGYWKDLLNILGLAALNQLTAMEYLPLFLYPRYSDELKTNRKPWRDPSEKEPVIDKEAHAAVLRERQRLEISAARERRVNKAATLHANLLERLADPKFRALYVSVAHLFASQLLKDTDLLSRIEAMPEGDKRDALVYEVSFAGKWAPSPGLTHDRHTNISTAISTLLLHSKKLQTPQILAEFEQGLPAFESHVLRSFYHRWVLTPLREIKSVPERLMSANRWKEIRYNRLTKKCLRRNRKHFYPHDPEGFGKYLTDVQNSKKPISSVTPLPHELINDAMRSYSRTQYDPVPGKPIIKDLLKETAETRIGVVDAHWNTTVDRLRESGTLDNAIAVCDISGSMGTPYDAGRRRKDGFTQPMFPALSLSILFGQLAKPPFTNCFVTFSPNPQLVQFNPSESLAKIAHQMVATDWGMNTDYNTIFLKLLLPLAVKHNVKPEDMIKRLFVFSDMQFDESQGVYDNYMSYAPPDPQHKASEVALEKWKTDYGAVEKAFEEAGYQVPQIVYWNLGYHAASIPALSDRKGVTYMNGFSPEMLKGLMGESEGLETGAVEQDKGKGASEKKLGESDPVEAMKAAVSKKSYDGLVVMD